MAHKNFEHFVEGIRSGLAFPFRAAAKQLDNTGFEIVMPLLTLADSIEGLENGIDKRLISRWKKIVQVETDRVMMDVLLGKNLEGPGIVNESEMMRVEIMDTARENMGYHGVTRYEAQQQLIAELENMQKMFYPGLTG